MILLVRVDERLIHGQVVVGWRSALDARSFVVVDDDVAGSDWERDLVLSALPDGTGGDVLTVADAGALWETWRQDEVRRLILVQGVATLLAMREAGIRLEQVNMGGLHARPGRRAFLPYVYLDDEEIAACRSLCDAHVWITARNVPSASPVDLCRRLPSEGQ